MRNRARQPLKMKTLTRVTGASLSSIKIKSSSECIQGRGKFVLTKDTGTDGFSIKIAENYQVTMRSRL